MAEHLGGEYMKVYRTQTGLSQKKLGELLGVKQADISLYETGRRAIPPEVAETFFALLAQSPGKEPERPSGQSAAVLLAELTAARAEMGRPIGPEEAAALAGMEAGELLSQSILLREALEVQASRELLAGAKAFRKRRETARRGGGGPC